MDVGSCRVKVKTHVPRHDPSIFELADWLRELQRERDTALQMSATSQREMERALQAQQDLARQLERERQMSATSQREMERANQDLQRERAEKRQLQQQLASSITERQQQQQQLQEKIARVAALNDTTAQDAVEKEQLRAQFQQQTTAVAEAALPTAFQTMSMSPMVMSDSARARYYKMRAELAESQMLEIYTLFTSKLRDFDVKRLIAHGTEGVVFLATCQKPRLRDQTKEYALKAMFNIFRFATVTQVRQAFQNEYEVLANLPFHDNIVRLLAFFYDRMGDNLPGLDRFDALRDNARTLSLFLVMEFLPENLEALSNQFRNSGQLAFEVFLDWSKQLAEAANFLTAHQVVHRDMKLNNVLVDRDGKLKVCDFGFAIHTQTAELTLRYFPNMPLGGNPPHLAPEVLRVSETQGSQDGMFVNYSKQSVWELGVLMHELATGQSPFQAIDQQGYVMADVPDVAIPRSSANQAAAQYVMAELQGLVRRMLSFEPARRPTISQVLTALQQYTQRFPIQ